MLSKLSAQERPQTSHNSREGNYRIYDPYLQPEKHYPDVNSLPPYGSGEPVLGGGSENGKVLLPNVNGIL